MPTAEIARTATVPDPGQLVEVRRRQFVVLEVKTSALPDDPLRKTNGHAQHLVHLSSVEEDALGEELQVIWELEPGARVFEKIFLPDPTGFDEPRRLDAFLDAVRWGAVASADNRLLQSPFRSGIAVEDYQLDPVVRALQMPRANLLIADDVGLGKTIEAGLVAQELILRHRVRSILIVCPASIQVQWRDEMREKFGLEFRIVDADLMRDLRRRRGLHVNPWSHFPRLITSIDFLKRERPMRLFREVLPAAGEPAYPRRFDLLIVDEAHNVAPSGSGRYATDSLRTMAIRTLAPHFEHKLFLSATPHNGYQESFSALLELLDDQRFARAVRPDPSQLRAVMVRRMKTEIENWDGTPRFPNRKLEPLEVPYTGAERDAHANLQRYTELRQKAAKEADERFASEFVLKLLKKRMFSSPAAFQKTLQEHEKTLRTGGERSRAIEKRLPLGVLRRELEQVEEDQANDEEFEESAAAAVGTATSLLRAFTDEEKTLLQKLRDWARQASARPDSKARKLIEWVESTLRPGGPWNDERVIVFTEYRETQKWLQGLLAAAGLASGERLLTIHGGMDSDEREKVKAAFQASPKEAAVRILLATDAASEGINLQNHCHRVIHYEIPWNPNRMEQRNGRVDRHGQRAKEVLVYHFVGQGYAEHTARAPTAPGDLEGDLEFLMRAAIKVNAIREDLGKVGSVIASQVEEAMLGRRRSLDTSTAEQGAEPVRRMLRFERKLREDIARFRERLSDSRRELRLSPENVRSVVEVGLALAGQPRLQEANLPGIWPAPTGRRSECPVFRMPRLKGSWAACTEGLLHPHTGIERPIAFDHSIAEGRDDVVLVHLNHRLVQLCLRLLRAEVWSPGDQKGIHRVTARVVPNAALDTPAAIAHGRIVVLGGDNQRLHEEVIFAGGAVRDGRFARMTLTQAQAALDQAGRELPGDAAQKRLSEVWLRIREPLLAALEARMKERGASVERLLEERAAKESSDLAAILKELERSIREELDAPEPAQKELFAPTECEQLERNLESLRRRLEAIPGEIEQETARVHARFSNPTPRLFPVAVTFVVPERLARGA